MFNTMIDLLATYEPIISALVGIVSLCAAIAGFVRYRMFSRSSTVSGEQASSGEQRADLSGLLNLGVKDHSKLEELVAIRTVNIVLICLLVLSLTWLIASLVFLRAPLLSLINMLVFVGVILGFALQQGGAHSFARWLVVFVTTAYWLGVIMTVGGYQGAEYFIAGLVALPVLIFSRAQWVQRLVCLAFLALTFLIGVYMGGVVEPVVTLDNKSLAVGYYGNALFLTMIIVSVVGYYKWYAAKNSQHLASAKLDNEELVSRLYPAASATQNLAWASAEPRQHSQATIVSCSLVGLEDLYSVLSASELVAHIEALFGIFDEICSQSGIHKIKTIGSAYFGVHGLGAGANDCVETALSILRIRNAVEEYERRHSLPVGFTAVISTGVTITGALSQSRPQFDVWGESIDKVTALEASLGAGEIALDEATAQLLERKANLELKAGNPPTYLLREMRDQNQ